MKPENTEAHLKVARFSATKLATTAATIQHADSTSPEINQPEPRAAIAYLIPVVAVIIPHPLLSMIRNKLKNPIHS